MDRHVLVEKVQMLAAEVEIILAEKKRALEEEQVDKSSMYAWVREQMISIHQLKHQFTLDVATLHQEAALFNQEMRCRFDQLRQTEFSLFHQAESHGAGNIESACSE